MNINREKKEKLVAEMSDAFDRHNTFYLMDFMNMPVNLAVELRGQLRERSYSFKVIKNRLALRALNEEFPEELRQHFRGPTAVAFASENPIGLARLLRDFSNQYNVLNIKAGFVEGKFLTKERFSEIANLTSKEELLAKFGFLLAYPLFKLSKTWQAPLMSLGSMLSQLKTKK